MRTTIFLSMFVLIAPAALRGDCKCARPNKEETTRWGGNEVVVVVKESPVKQLQGVVEEPGGSPFAGALVEIFNHPEYLLSDLPSAQVKKPEQQRVGVCLTRSDGKFCFKHLPPGTYEIRSSISTGWDVTKVHVTVDPKKGKSERIAVPMHIGT